MHANTYCTKTAKKTGLVKDVDQQDNRALLTFYDTETATRCTFWYSIEALAKPTRSVNHPYQDLKMPRELKRESALSFLSMPLFVLGSY